MSKSFSFSAPGSSGYDTFEGPYWSAQMLATCDSGNVQATVVVEATNTPGDAGSWQTLDTLTNVSGASPQRDFGSGGPVAWAAVRARCTALTGTGAQVSVVFNAH